jgi:hypothetical protein
MQSSRSIQPTVDAIHTSSRRRPPDLANQVFANRVLQITFRKSGKPRIALTNYHAKITTSRIKFRMECVGKTCCAATYRSPLPAGNPLPQIRFRTFAYWSWRRDLNPRPPDYKSGALPTELRQHFGEPRPTGTSIPLIPSRCPGQLAKLSQGSIFAQPSWGQAIRGCAVAMV